VAIVETVLIFLFLFTAHRAWKADDRKRRQQVTSGPSAPSGAEQL
jgi:hypothetical protein